MHRARPQRSEEGRWRQRPGVDDRCNMARAGSFKVKEGTALRVRDADRALFAALAEPTVSALRVTIPRARADEHLAGGSRSRVPPRGGAMLTLLRLPF